jgi:hypothetical protein
LEDQDPAEFALQAWQGAHGEFQALPFWIGGRYALLIGVGLLMLVQIDSIFNARRSDPLNSIERHGLYFYCYSE